MTETQYITYCKLLKIIEANEATGMREDQSIALRYILHTIMGVIYDKEFNTEEPIKITHPHLTVEDVDQLLNTAVLLVASNT